jgi:translation initiation factor eIF-2B subunit alpha
VEDQRVVEDFRRRVGSSPHTAIAVCAIQTLTSVVRQSSSTTMMGLEIELNSAVGALKACNPASISLAAGCELFSRYVTRASLDIPRFEECVARLLERGEQFSLMSSNSRATIAALVDRFISDGKVILTHGYSRVVQAVLVHAAQAGKNFSVLVTEGRPNSDGYHAAAELVKAGIPVTLILDSAVAYSMDQVDLVLIGAEGVAESGGIINKIGTYQMSLCATMMKKPVYVAAESYKFARLFPLDQNDLPETKDQQPPFRPAVQLSANTAAGQVAAPGTSTSAPPAAIAASAELLFAPASAKQYADKLTMLNPSCDYTPPQFLTLLFTDIGILTPSAVSDELIKLYY